MEKKKQNKTKQKKVLWGGSIVITEAAIYDNTDNLRSQSCFGLKAAKLWDTYW